MTPCMKTQREMAPNISIITVFALLPGILVVDVRAEEVYVFGGARENCTTHADTYTVTARALQQGDKSLRLFAVSFCSAAGYVEGAAPRKRRKRRANFLRPP